MQPSMQNYLCNTQTHTYARTRNLVATNIGKFTFKF